MGAHLTRLGQGPETPGRSPQICPRTPFTRHLHGGSLPRSDTCREAGTHSCRASSGSVPGYPNDPSARLPIRALPSSGNRHLLHHADRSVRLHLRRPPGSREVRVGDRRHRPGPCSAAHLPIYPNTLLLPMTLFLATPLPPLRIASRARLALLSSPRLGRR
jgi:hypothetical protein